jgi:cytoskeletal protein RodZ
MRRGLSRETAVQQTHIPAHYVQMLEDDDYRRICDRLYLLPFLRKYASFLQIDSEETAMRLLRDVQRSDESSSSAQLAEPRDATRTARRRDWTTPLLFSGLIAVIVGAYTVQSRYGESDPGGAAKPHSVQPAVASSPSSLTEIVNPAAQAATASATQPGPSGHQRRPSQTKTAVSQLRQ